MTTAICGTLLFAAFSVPTVRADEWDKKTTVTFSDSVQVPGMTLPAGTYIFKLVENRADRYVVQIFNDRESHVYTTLMAIPNYHMTTPEKTQISFYEVPSGQPPALKAWFYPGDNFGRQFVYPKGEASLLAKATKENVPTDERTATTTDESAKTVTTDQSTPAESKVETTDNTATAQSTVTEPPAPVDTTTTVDTTTATVAPQAEPDQQPQPEPQPITDNHDNDGTTLPSTASDWPLVGLIGLGSLAGAFAVRTFAARLS